MLAALGYKGFTVDDEYTSATASAVRDWQEDLGLDETGTVDVGRVVFAPAPVRVSEVKAHLGDPGSGTVLGYTGTDRGVTVKLDVSKQDLAKTGASAKVKLPDGTVVAGTVAAVGTVATQATEANGQPGKTTIEVTVTVADQTKLGTYDEAPVTVTLVSRQRKDVLVVPVAALLAQGDGGYGVQVVSGSQVKLVPVKTGLFADGRVEISGDGIAAGTEVGMPS